MSVRRRMGRWLRTVGQAHCSSGDTQLWAARGGQGSETEEICSTDFWRTAFFQEGHIQVEDHFKWEFRV